MKKKLSKEQIIKGLPYAQTAAREDTETIVNIDYEEYKMYVYSNRATVINRMIRKGYIPVDIFYIEGELDGMKWEFDTKDIGKIMRTGIFSYSSGKTNDTEEIEEEGNEEE